MGRNNYFVRKDFESDHKNEPSPKSALTQKMYCVFGLSPITLNLVYFPSHISFTTPVLVAIISLYDFILSKFFAGGLHTTSIVFEVVIPVSISSNLSWESSCEYFCWELRHFIVNGRGQTYDRCMKEKHFEKTKHLFCTQPAVSFSCRIIIVNVIVCTYWWWISFKTTSIHIQKISLLTHFPFINVCILC